MASAPAPPDDEQKVERQAWHALDAAAALTALDSGEKGLTSAEAAARLERYGPNLLPVSPPESAWRVLIRQLRSIVVLLLVAAMGVSLAMGDLLEAAAIAVVLVLNTVIGLVMELKARRSLEALLQLEAPGATVLRDGEPREISARELVPGDVIVLEEGARIPADARVVRATELRTGEAELTGESLPVDKSADLTLPDDAPLAERQNLVFMSTHVLGGSARALVVETGARTEVGQIGTLLGGIVDSSTPLERRLDALGRSLVWLALAAGAAVGGLAFLSHLPAYLAIETALALAIAAVPEALPAVATVTLAIGVRRIARRHALVRRLPAVETLGGVTVICTDKTGTLTAGEMTVREILAGGESFTVTGAGYEPEGEILHEGEVADLAARPALALALRIGALANRASLTKRADGWKTRGDPTELALLAIALKAGIDPAAESGAEPETGEIPFSSDRKYMASFRRAADGVARGYVKGAPRPVLERCTRILRADGSAAALEPEERDALLARNREIAGRGLRVLALAYADADAGGNGAGGAGGPKADAESLGGLVFVGLAGLQDPPAAGVQETIARFDTAGIRVILITGDQRETARAVGAELGIVAAEGAALDGNAVAALSDAELAHAVGDARIFYRTTTAHKLRIIDALRANGEIVAMLGDGVNAAAALKQADVGVAMGGRGTDLAKAAADVVLRDDRFATIGAAVEEGRVIFANIRKFVFYLFSCNLAEIMVLLSAGILGLAPLRPLQILWMNLVTDTLPALALAAEPGEPDIMRRPPLDPRAPLLSRAFLRTISLYAALMAAATMAAYLFTHVHRPERALTAAFTTLALAQLLHLGNARSVGPVLAPRAAGSNRWALLALVVTAALQVAAVTFPPLARVLGLVPLGVVDWVIVVAAAATPAVLGQLWKLVRHRPQLRGEVG
jgi:Ca2+-transporting ATPase